MATDAPQQRYELVSTLGKGGMAEVFLGWMNSVGGLRRKVAIKRILPDLVQKQSKLFEQMFVDEARLAFQLEHDNIVRVYDVGQSANTFFIVMEYVEGMDLKRIYEKMAERRQLLDLNTCMYLGTQVAAGLAYAHTLTDDEDRLLGLVHNDISPPNILVGRHGEVKIADFGLSDARGHSVETPEGMVKGKFAYISPESTRDPSLVSYRSDIFSVGIVLWELMTGRRLFQKDNDLDTFQAVRDARVPNLRKVRPDVPRDVADIIHKALAPDPNQRYQSCEALYADLTEASYRNNLALRRFDLSNLVNEVAGRREAFSGTKVSEEAALDLALELDGMLPPGVAAHLKTFVTGAKVADDVEDSDFVQEDWAADVFGDVGFDEDEMGEGDFAEEAPTHPEPPQMDLAPEPPQMEMDFPQGPPPAHPSDSALSPVAEPSNPRATSDSMMAAMQAEMQSQRVTYVIWGSIVGLVLGAGLGFAIGTLL